MFSEGLSGGVCGKRLVQGTGRPARRPRCGRPCGLAQSLSAACEATVPPTRNLWLPPSPAGRPCLRASEREAPHLSILSLSHSFLVKNEADAYPLAGDNVRINDKICKARSAALGRGKKKKKVPWMCYFP